MPQLVKEIEKQKPREAEFYIVLGDAWRSKSKHPEAIAAYEEAIATRRFRPIAMSVFASGAIPPREAVAYVCGQPRIESIVFGASGRANIRQTNALIRELTVSRALPTA